MLSDGYPAAAGNQRDLNKHLRYAVQYTEKSGIETIGIGIKDTAVQQFYPKSIVINDLSELPPAVVGQLKRILIDNKKIAHA